MVQETDSVRLARIEERLDSMDNQLRQLNTTRDEFIALKARWGIVAAVIGSGFAALVSFISSMLDRLGS